MRAGEFAEFFHHSAKPSRVKGVSLGSLEKQNCSKNFENLYSESRRDGML